MSTLGGATNTGATSSSGEATARTSHPEATSSSNRRVYIVCVVAVAAIFTCAIAMHPSTSALIQNGYMGARVFLQNTLWPLAQSHWQKIAAGAAVIGALFLLNRPSREAPSLTAAKENRLEDLQRLYEENPAAIEALDKRGNNALHRAACEGNTEIVNWLINLREDTSHIDLISQNNKKGLSPAAYAALSVLTPQEECVAALLSVMPARAIKESADAVARRGNIEDIEKFLKCVPASSRTIPSVKDSGGDLVLEDPLHIAAFLGAEIALSKLLDNASYVNVHTEDGRTVLHLIVLSPEEGFKQGALIEPLFRVCENRVNTEIYDASNRCFADLLKEVQQQEGGRSLGPGCFALLKAAEDQEAMNRSREELFSDIARRQKAAAQEARSEKAVQS